MKRNKKPARWEFLNELDGRPTDNFVASNSHPKLSVGLTLVTAFLGVAFLIMELN